MIDNGASRADKLVLFICALVIAAAIALFGSAQIAFGDEESTDDPANESPDYELDLDDGLYNEASDLDDEASDWDDDESWDWGNTPAVRAIPIGGIYPLCPERDAGGN